MYATFLRAAFGTKKRAWAVIVAWVLLVGILGAMSQSIDDVKAAGDDGAPADAASAMAEERLREAFPGRDDVLPAIITISADDEATARGAAAAVTDHFRGAVGERTLAPISASCAEPGSGLRPGADCMPAGVEGTRSGDGLTRSLIVPVVGDPTTAEFRDDVAAMRRAAADAADGATTHLTGPAGIVTDTVKVAASGDAGRITVVLAVDPYEPEAMDSLPALEDAARGALADAGAAGATVTATGETATSADIRSGLESDTLLLIPLILGIVGLVLGLLLRSILAPIYLVATLALSFVATVGLTVFIAVTVQGDSGIGNRVTAYILVFLIALGVDYTIFLMSRVRQELAHSGMREALRTSLVRTGGVVSSAGLILAATFAVLMTQPIRELYQFGLAMALGILLDTFVVRPLLVPAIVRLIGDRALWPIESAKRDRPKEPVESA